MKIVGKQVNSFVDFPGKIAYVVFTAGCNMNCWYCHNLQAMNSKIYIPREEILGDISFRKGFVDGVVITGGEPTLQPDLPEFIAEIKKMGLAVKLDTNGSNPTLLEVLLFPPNIGGGTACGGGSKPDYIAMDIKATQKKHVQISGFNKFDDILKSIEIIKKSGVEHEFRTTFCPDLSKEDIEEIAKLAEGADLYAVQQYRNPENGNPRARLKPHSPEYVAAAAALAGKYVKTIVRGV